MRPSGVFDSEFLHVQPKSSNFNSTQTQNLPIHAHKLEILYALEKYSTVVLVSDTGTGKSTQVPQYLYSSGWASEGKAIVCTQPRRVAVLSISKRVAQEVGCILGDEVGYMIRFDSKYSNKTKIKYCTDGVLIREIMSDPLLSAYSVVMIDEVSHNPVSKVFSSRR